MSRQLSTPGRIAAGATAGLLAGLVASFVMDQFQALTQPSSDDYSEPATQQAADSLSTLATGSPLGEQQKPLGGQVVHYGLGAALGTGYGIAAEFVPQVTIGAGSAFATATWVLLDEAAVPAVGLGDPPRKASLATQGYGLVSHIVFGLAAERTRRVTRNMLG